MNPVKDVIVTWMVVLGVLLPVYLPLIVTTPAYVPFYLVFASFIAAWVTARRCQLRRRRTRTGTLERHQATIFMRWLDVTTILMWMLTIVLAMRAGADLPLWLGLSPSVYQVYVSVRSLSQDDDFWTDVRRTVTSWFTVSQPTTSGAS